MARGLCALALAVALAQGPSAKDPALAKGIALVKEGDFEAAVLALDGVVRRLAASPRRDQSPAAKSVRPSVSWRIGRLVRCAM